MTGGVERVHWEDRVISSLGWAALGASTTWILAFVLSATAQSERSLGSVGFGWPFVWIRQDQTALASDYPFTTRLHAPWTYATDVSLWWFLIDAAFFTGLAMLVWWGVRRLLRTAGSAEG